MSRIILKRHENGEEGLTAGYDRPLGYFFIDEYDDEGEAVEEHCRGFLSGESLNAMQVADIANEYGWTGAREVLFLRLQYHATLDYPESNIVEDWSLKEAK